MVVISFSYQPWSGSKNIFATCSSIPAKLLMLFTSQITELVVLFEEEKWLAFQMQAIFTPHIIKQIFSSSNSKIIFSSLMTKCRFQANPFIIFIFHKIP